MSGWWERHGVPRLIKCACSQGQIMKARSKVVPAAAGDVLELGCGGGINMEFYADLRNPSRSRRNVSEVETAQRNIISNHWSLSLNYIYCNCGLIISSCSENPLFDCR